MMWGYKMAPGADSTILDSFYQNPNPTRVTKYKCIPSPDRTY